MVPCRAREFVGANSRHNRCVLVLTRENSVTKVILCANCGASLARYRSLFRPKLPDDRPFQPHPIFTNPPSFRPFRPLGFKPKSRTQRFGNRLVHIGIDLDFGERTADTQFAEIDLKEATKQALNSSIRSNPSYEIFFNDLHLFSPIGHYDATNLQIYSKFTFAVTFSQANMINVQASPSNPISLSSQESLSFSYSAD
jgi:hypothetical protein